MNKDIMLKNGGVKMFNITHNESGKSLSGLFEWLPIHKKMIGGN